MTVVGVSVARVSFNIGGPVGSASLSAAELSEEIFEFVCDYRKQFSAPVSLKILAQKYGKRARVSGLSFLSFIRSDKRLLVELTKSGAYVINPLAAVNLGKVMMVVLEQNGGSLPLSALREQLKEMRFEDGRIKETLDRLIMIGSVSFDAAEGVVKIPDSVLGF